MLHFRVMATHGLTALAVTAAVAAHIGAQTPKPLPLKYVGPATVPAITSRDLMTRLYVYADDSMGGRDVGTEYHLKATAYIEQQVRALGLKPAGDNGGYFQNIQVIHRAFDTASTLTIDGATYMGGADFLAVTAGPTRRIDGAPVLVWYIFDTTTTPTPAQLAGKIVALRTSPQPPNADLPLWLKTAAYQTYIKIVQGTGGNVGRIAVLGDTIPAAQVNTATNPNGPSTVLAAEQSPVVLLVTTRVITAILGAPLATVASGTIAKSVSADLRFNDVARPGRNVIAILPGSDPKLRGEYVAIGAHNDHVGTGARSVGEHDSLRIYNAIGRPAGAEGGRNFTTSPITTEEWAKINSDIADLRKTYPSRPDSIYNGADDDGTGTVSVLEMAEAFAKGNVKPKRSLIFVWHAGEEHGMWGSGYFMDNPTVPRDSIVAQLNIDMVGRGAATDVTGQKKEGGVLHGGDRYVQLVGSRRLSTELGDLVEKVNQEKHHRFLLDYNIDADGHPQNIYCRSDHWSYAKWGVPVVFFTTGGHADYHQVTDEPQYIRYDHMAALDRLIFDVAVGVANLDHRVVVDKPKPNPAPATTCKQ